MSKRFNVQVIAVDGDREEVSKNYITVGEVHALVDAMAEDDELVIQRTQNSSPGEL